MKRQAIEFGRLVAEGLVGSWRSSPPRISIDSSLDPVRLNILRSASAGLVWWKILNSDLRHSVSGREFENAFRLYTLSASIHANRLSRLLELLHSNRIEPILAKGWAIARCYPRPGMRPYGDFDVCIRKGDRASVLSILDKERDFDVDIHEGFRELEGSYDELLERSRRIPVGKDYVCILSPEDHLRLLAVHGLYHGVWKPVWLCDVALALESAGTEFDWDLCFSGDERRTECVLAAITLSHQVLGAELPSRLQYLQKRSLPGWTYNALYEQWGRVGHYMQGRIASELLRHGHIFETLRDRWPNPIQATVRMKGGFNWLPRLPYQLGDALLRGARLMRVIAQQ